MKNNFKKKITAILAVTLAAVTFLTVPVSAIEVVGNGSGGGSSSTTSGGSYKLPVLGSSTSYCAGYRLTVITANGVRRNGTSTIDVYCSNSDFANHIKNNTAYYSSGLYYKTEISSGFISGGGADRDIGNKKFDKNTAIWNSSIPQDATQMTNNATGGVPYFKTDTGSDVLDNLLIKMGLSGIKALQNGNKVLIEPLFLLTIANTEYLLTVTEIGLYGFKMFGDVVPASSGDTGSWANIAYYTNAYWPMSCEITEDLSYGGITIWYAAGTLTTGNPGRGSFGDLIRKGYGVAFAYNNTNPPTTPVDLYPTSITYWTAQTGGTYVTELVEGGTYWPKFHYHNNGSIAVTAQVNAWSYPLNNWEVNNVDITIGANRDYEIMGDYPITINNGLYYRNFGIENAQKYDTYEYNQNTIVHDWSITLTDSKATESNPNNNWATFSHKFSPKQPNISQWIIDRENAASSWITGAVNNRIIYSGEQTNSQVRFTNISSFKLQINEYFKALLGLNNNPIASYSKTNDPTWHTSGGVWDRETATFRAKNTKNGTNETLYLRASAGERSFASAMGININDANHITENINLNKQVFFKSQAHTNTSGGTVTVNWDNNARTLLLNGTMDTSFIDSVSAINVPCDLRKGNTYKVTVEYVSGSVSSPNSPLNSCIAFETTYNNGSDRIYTDVNYPKCSAVC